MKKLNEFLLEIGCPQKCIDKCIFKFLNSIFQHKPKITTVLKKELRIALPYLRNMLNITKTKLKKSVNKDFSNLKSFFKTTNKLKNYFYFKDLVTKIV